MIQLCKCLPAWEFNYLGQRIFSCGLNYPRETISRHNGWWTFHSSRSESRFWNDCEKWLFPTLEIFWNWSAEIEAKPSNEVVLDIISKGEYIEATGLRSAEKDLAITITDANSFPENINLYQTSQLNAFRDTNYRLERSRITSESVGGKTTIDTHVPLRIRPLFCRHALKCDLLQWTLNWAIG